MWENLIRIQLSAFKNAGIKVISMHPQQLTGNVTVQIVIMNVTKKQRDADAEPMEMVVEPTITNVFNAYTKAKVRKHKETDRAGIVSICK